MLLIGVLLMTTPPVLSGPPGLNLPGIGRAGLPTRGIGTEACMPPGLDLKLGQMLPSDVAERFAGQQMRLRIVRPGDRLTMDHLGDRLNVVVDGEGRVIRLYCG